MDAAKLDVKNTYLDPGVINEASHTRPLTWQDDHPALKGAKGKAREKIRKVAHKEARSEVILYIGKSCYLVYVGPQTPVSCFMQFGLR
jgi:hypothetical protein